MRAAPTAENGSALVSLHYCELTYSRVCAIIGLPPQPPSHERIARNLPLREEVAPNRMTACHAPADPVER
jgi:hypothetical protein